QGPVAGGVKAPLLPDRVAVGRLAADVRLAGAVVADHVGVGRRQRPALLVRAVAAQVDVAAALVAAVPLGLAAALRADIGDPERDLLGPAADRPGRASQRRDQLLDAVLKPALLPPLRHLEADAAQLELGRPTHATAAR